MMVIQAMNFKYKTLIRSFKYLVKRQGDANKNIFKGVG